MGITTIRALADSLTDTLAAVDRLDAGMTVRKQS